MSGAWRPACDSLFDCGWSISSRLGGGAQTAFMMPGRLDLGLRYAFVSWYSSSALTCHNDDLSALPDAMASTAALAASME